MKRKLSAVLMAAFVSLAPLWSNHASAATVLTGGQKHYYTVQMRSDRQAITYAKIIFEAQHTDDLTTYEFSLPSGVSVENLSVQQILAKSSSKKCAVYETTDEWRKRMSADATTLYTAPDSAYDMSKLCLTYEAAPAAYDEDFDYDNNSSGGMYFTPEYYSSPDKTYEYKDITPKVDGSHYTLTLPVTIKAEKQGAILVSFTSKNYISGGLGYYTYDYRTFITKQMIESATVAINFDEDLYSREATQQRTVETAATSDLSVANGATASYKSKSLTDIQLGVGRGGQVFKTQTKMLPGDVLSVKGVFATNRFLLYGAELLTALIVAVLAVVGVVAYRRYRRKHPRAVTTQTNGQAQAHGLLPTFRRVFSTPAGSISVGRMIGVSLISVASTAITLLALSGIYSGVVRYYSSVASFIMLVTALSTSYLLLVAAPTLYVKTYGARRAFMWTCIHVAIILVIGMLLIVFTSGIGESGIYPV